MIKAVFFDAIDTLFCAYPDKIRMYQRIIREIVGIEVTIEAMDNAWNETIEQIESNAQNFSKDENYLPLWDGFNAKILQKLGYSGTDIQEKGELLRLESWTNPHNFCLFYDVRPALESLYEKGIIIGCISNEAEGLNKFFTHFDIDEYFKTIVISEVVGIEKPNKKIFEIALEKLNLKPNEVIFVGDSYISDYLGAKYAGMEAILIDREDNMSDNSITKIKNLCDIDQYLEGEKIESTT